MITLFTRIASNLYRNNRRFFWYCVIGASGATLDFASFYVLTKMLHVFYQLANAFSVTIGITNNFFWNSFFNFRIKTELVKRFASFFSVGLLGLALSALLLFILIEKLRVSQLTAKSLTIVVIAVIQYHLNKLITFGTVWIKNTLP